jgi:hypothetical protein
MTATPQPRDLKLRACMNSFKWDDEEVELHSQAVRQIAETYSRNVRRVYSLVLFPPSAINIAITVQRVVDRVEHQNPTLPREQCAELAKTEINRQISRASAILEKGGEDAKRLFNIQQETSFALLSKLNPEFYDGPEAWMASQIIATWTAFEALAEDLWVAALNLKPAILAKLKGKKSSRPKDTDDPKRIRLDSIFRYDFDIAHKMGTIFLEENRYAFDSLKGIREAYKDAFSEDADAVLKLIDSKSLDAMSLVRNNLVHNGGIIDERTRRQSSDLPTPLSGLSVGEPILLDGEIVSVLNGPVIENGRDLLVAVDSWLAAH